MRWDGQTLDADDPNALPGMGRLAGLVRTVRTPEFAGITFHEVRCRSALNRIAASSPVPFRWTINPYRGCTHACVYCFARPTHSYLELDAGHDFDTQIVVKINLADVLRRELSGPRWRNEHVAMGTNTDPYQRAEGRYRLMPDVITALTERGTPFSILTKAALLSRDLPLIAEAADRVPVGVAVSLALLEPGVQALLEPGAPTPRARLELVRRIRAAGLGCSVLVAPILPHLTDSAAQLEALVAELAEAGATSITGLPLRLMAGTKEWFLAWLQRERPELVSSYEQLYRRGASPPRWYAEELRHRLASIVQRAPLDPDPGPRRRPSAKRRAPPSTAAADRQVSLF
jgi:DNA repair photolyase